MRIDVSENGASQSKLVIDMTTKIGITPIAING